MSKVAALPTRKPKKPYYTKEGWTDAPLVDLRQARDAGILEERARVAAILNDLATEYPAHQWAWSAAFERLKAVE